MSVRDKSGHSCLGDIEVSDGCMIFAGRRLDELVAEAGQTPFYAYDRKAITERVQLLRNSMPESIHLHYAMKANPMPAVVRHLAGLVDGIDVASAGELRVALENGGEAGSVSFAGPGKTPVELSCAIEAGVVINIESDLELNRIVELGSEKGVRPRIAIRVNPDFELKTSGMKMAGGPKQFGIDAERVPDVLRRLAALDVEFVGFHIFSGSQNLRHDAICDTQQKTVELAIELLAHVPSPVSMLNIGGGFGIPYFPGESPLDIRPVAENLSRLTSVVESEMPQAAVILELGRYLVGEAGIYVCRIVDRKVSRGQVFLVADGGLHHHLAASGNFGQVIRKNYPVLIGNNVNGAERETASVVGPLCTPLDLLADKMEMSKADVGDLVVVLQSGAYGLTASPTAFLSHPLPGEFLF